MNNLNIQKKSFSESRISGANHFFNRFKMVSRIKKGDKTLHPLRVIVNKEISDHVRS